MSNVFVLIWVLMTVQEIVYCTPVIFKTYILSKLIKKYILWKYDYLFGIVEILQRNLSKNKSLPEIYVYKMQTRLIENKQAVNDNNTHNCWILVLCKLICFTVVTDHE